MCNFCFFPQPPAAGACDPSQGRHFRLGHYCSERQSNSAEAQGAKGAQKGWFLVIWGPRSSVFFLFSLVFFLRIMLCLAGRVPLAGRGNSQGTCRLPGEGACSSCQVRFKAVQGWASGTSQGRWEEGLACWELPAAGGSLLSDGTDFPSRDGAD